MKNNLPVFEFVIDDSQESGVKAVSIVSDPAFKSHAIFLAKDKPKFVVLADKKKQIVAGLSLIPDVPVYRYDQEEDLEYYGYFSKDTIAKIVDKYHAEMLQNKVNLEHSDQTYIDAYLVEDYIVNSDARVQDLKAMGIEHPNIMGAWYTAFKVKDPEIFNFIETNGTATGFSVEAYLNRVMTDFKSEVKNKLITNKVKSEMKKINKSIKEKILSIFADLQVFERSLVPELAFEIEWTEVGQPVNKVNVDENGNETLTPVGQGEFATEMGIVVVDEASNLVEVRELPAEPVVKTPEVPASGDTTSISGATDVVGDQSAKDAQIPPVSGTTSGDTSNMAAYPWDKCISDQLAKGISQTGAEKICGWIKANNSQEEMEALMEKELSADDLACIKKKKMEDDLAVSGDTTQAQPTNGLNKTIAELCPVAGDYIIQVCVDDQGNVTEASVTSQKDLLPEAPEGEMKSAFSDRVKKLFARVVELEAKMKEPIGDPILTPTEPTVDFSKMSAYERMMHKKGLKPV